MKTHLLSAILVFFSIGFITIFPLVIESTEILMASPSVPSNNADVAGVQIYNVPPVGKNIPNPNLSAKSVLVMDLNSETILYQKQSVMELPIASTTKIMTALVASKYFKANSVLTVNEGAKVSGAKVGLITGEELSFRSLLYGMLLNSGNDAAFVIAENYPGGINGFVTAMNEESIRLGLENTHFDNPAGFDSPKHYSSAEDLYKITREALKDTNLAKIFATKDTEILSIDKKHKFSLHNLNKLLSTVTGVMGIKTGFTDAAKENLVTLVSRDDKKILTVVLGSNDRFGESTALIEWAYANFQWSD